MMVRVRPWLLPSAFRATDFTESASIFFCCICSAQLFHSLSHSFMNCRLVSCVSWTGASSRPASTAWQIFLQLYCVCIYFAHPKMKLPKIEHVNLQGHAVLASGGEEAKRALYWIGMVLTCACQDMLIWGSIFLRCGLMTLGEHQDRRLSRSAQTWSKSKISSYCTCHSGARPPPRKIKITISRVDVANVVINSLSELLNRKTTTVGHCDLF